MNIWNKINIFFDKDKNVLILSFLFLLMLSSPLLLLGGNVPYEVWDNLDSNVVWRKLMIDNHMIFADSFAVIPQIMSGIPRISLSSELNLFVLLAKIFPPTVSLGVNRFLQIMVGFWGMYLLCRKYIIIKHNALLSAVVAILFAVLPFWSSGCLSIAMQPMVLYSFLKIRDKNHNHRDWAVMCVYPFVSSFIVFGFFFYCFLFAIFCMDWYKKKTLNRNLFLALAVLSILSLITQYREILYVFADNGFVSHRTESTREIAMLTSLPAVINQIKSFLIFGQGHVPSNHYLILWFCVLFMMINSIMTRKINRKAMAVLFIIISISLYCGIMKWQPVHSTIYNIPLFNLFNIERFYTLFPILWFILLAYTFNEIPKNKFTVAVFALFFLVQLRYSRKHDFTFNGLWNRYVYGVKNASTLSFNEYYSEDLFDKVKKETGKQTDTYRVAALGLHPALLQYNGFYTIDGYCGNYDVKYKHLFGTVIRGELNKNKELQTYFDKWGNRCYLFDDEIGRLGRYKTRKTKTASLDVDYDLLKQKLNCQYIVSAVEIENLGEHLKLQKVFENNVYKIYLYKVI
ncbi:MAG: DUF6044 family protein [Flavobacteriaceae bacterium]|jgi:hypothetical protein|nr:DUF6044 family protein [Flavobacteriaceae bacterium]